MKHIVVRRYKPVRQGKCGRDERNEMRTWEERYTTGRYALHHEGRYTHGLSEQALTKVNNNTANTKL